MKKLVYILFALFALTACNKQKTFTVEGTIDGAKDSTIYLYNRSMTGILLLDSAKLGSDGKFRFKQEAPEGPDLYVLRIYNQFINLAIDSTETISIKAAQGTATKRFAVMH